MRQRARIILLASLLIGLLEPIAAEELPSDFTPFIRLGHLVKVSVYKNPTFDQNHSRIIRNGVLIKEKILEMPVGSATIVSSDGLILTNYHVYQVPDRNRYDKEKDILYKTERVGQHMLVYRLEDNDPLKIPVLQYYASPVSLDKAHDTALLKIVSDSRGHKVKRDDFSYVKFGNPFSLKLNENILIIGFPNKGGETVTITEGKFLGYYRNRRFPGLDGFIKTNAAMAPGNSGGATLNKSTLVGIPTAVTPPSSAGSDLGYIHPVTWALKVLAIGERKYGLTPPQIPVQWVQSAYNTDETIDHIYIMGHIISAHSRQSLSASVIVARPDRSLVQIKKLHQDLQLIHTSYLVQQMHGEGLSIEEISARANISPPKVQKMLENKLSKDNMQPDTLKFLQGEFFYQSAISDGGGFFIVTIPRGREIKMYLNKRGYRSVEKTFTAESGTCQYLEDIKLYQY